MGRCDSHTLDINSVPNLGSPAHRQSICLLKDASHNKIRRVKNGRDSFPEQSSLDSISHLVYKEWWGNLDISSFLDPGLMFISSTNPL